MLVAIRLLENYNMSKTTCYWLCVSFRRGPEICWQWRQQQKLSINTLSTKNTAPHLCSQIFNPSRHLTFWYASYIFLVASAKVLWFVFYSFFSLNISWSELGGGSATNQSVTKLEMCGKVAVQFIIRFWSCDSGWCCFSCCRVVAGTAEMLNICYCSLMFPVLLKTTAGDFWGPAVSDGTFLYFFLFPV